MRAKKVVKGQGDFYDSTYNALICVDLAFGHDPVRSFFWDVCKGLLLLSYSSFPSPLQSTGDDR